MTGAPPPHGSFCWAEIATSDPERVRPFYAALFGWSYDDFDMGQGGVYTLCLKNGEKAAGLYCITPGPQGFGMPSCWSAYVACDSVDRSAEDAVALGGHVLLEPFDIPDTGRMAVIADDQGAMLSLWQCDSATTGYPRAADLPGLVCWNELATPDLATATGFYGRLFGWSAKPVAGEPGGLTPYVEFLLDGSSQAGALPLAAIGEGVPSHWLVYVAVADADATAQTALQLGGSVRRPPFDVPGVGRCAVLADPAAAVFAVISLATAP